VATCDKKETDEKGREMLSESSWCVWGRQKKSQEGTLIFGSNQINQQEGLVL